MTIRPPEWTTDRHSQSEIASLCQRLVDQRAFDHAILDCVDVGIVTADDEGRVTFVNRAARELLRLPQEVSGELCPLLGIPERARELPRSPAVRRTFSYEVATPDGVALELELTVTRRERAHDARPGFYAIFRDVREKRQREEERRRFERLVAMGTMVAGFAHEVRNPVAALRSIAEELAENLAEAGLVQPHVGRMLQVLERIERLVRTSLQFGRPAAPRRALHQPWALVAAAVAEVGPRTRVAGEELRIELETDLPDVYCDEGQIAQALVILLNNALDAAGSPRRVLVRATRGRPAENALRGRKSHPPPGNLGWVRIEVVDDGPGIKPEILGRIFDPFFTTKAAGTGLGLSIAQQVVSENGARLEVMSTRGGPTTFAILVPAES